MAGKGAPIGNTYAAKERVWASAINQALEERGAELGRMGALKELAHKLLDRVQEGDITAKGIRDAIAALYGWDDGSDRYTWDVRQEKGEYGVRVEIRPR